MQWWCSAQGIAWTWSWRPYVGVWLMVLALAGWYWRAYRRAARETNGTHPRLRPGRVAVALSGILCLWIALDWPVGTLGSGYLASVHMVQFFLIAMIAPALLIYGWPLAAESDRDEQGVLLRSARALTHPVFATAAFILIVAATHAPLVVDALMVSQLGSFVLDMAWLVGGLLFWLPVMGGVPGRAPLRAPMNIAFIFAGSLSHTGVAMYLLLARFPVYRTYEMAPPIQGISPLVDQEMAGGLMLLGSMAIVLGAISVVFYRWQARVERESPSLPTSMHPGTRQP